MKRFSLVILALFICITCSAQIDFDVLFNKKKLKKRNTAFSYKRGFTNWICLQGNCENGEGIFHLDGNLFELFAQGTFKNGKLNGPATVYLFNITKKNLVTDQFKKDLMTGNPTPQYFKNKIPKAKYFRDRVRCPDEIYSGTFIDNVITKGTYTYYGTNQGASYTFQRFRMIYLGEHGPFQKYKYDKNILLFKYTGKFPPKFGTEIIPNMDHANSKIDIRSDSNQTVVTKTNNKDEFICKKYKNGHLYQTKILKGNEGISHLVKVSKEKYEGNDPETLKRIEYSKKFQRRMIVRNRTSKRIYSIMQIGIKGCLSLNRPENMDNPFSVEWHCDIENFEIAGYSRQCGLCKGKGKVKSKSWVTSTYSTETNMQGTVSKKKVVATETSAYLPGSGAPKLGNNQSARVSTSIIKCYECNGVGYVK